MPQQVMEVSHEVITIDRYGSFDLYRPVVPSGIQTFHSVDRLKKLGSRCLQTFSIPVREGTFQGGENALGFLSRSGPVVSDHIGLDRRPLIPSGR
jgi:hypothetical protein